MLFLPFKNNYEIPVTFAAGIFPVALNMQTHFLQIRPCAVMNSLRCIQLQLHMPTGMKRIHSNLKPLTGMQKNLGFGTIKYQNYDIVPQPTQERFVGLHAAERFGKYCPSFRS